MDYLLHIQIHKALGNVGNAAASFQLYAVGSWIAGFLAVLLAFLLLRRSRLPQASKGLVFALWILAVLTNLTALQRLYAVWRRLGAAPAESEPAQRSESPRHHDQGGAS